MEQLLISIDEQVWYHRCGGEYGEAGVDTGIVEWLLISVDDQAFTRMLMKLFKMRSTYNIAKCNEMLNSKHIFQLIMNEK